MFLEITLLAYALIGHLAVCVIIYNQLHATRLSHHAIKMCERLILLYFLSVPSAAYFLGLLPLESLVAKGPFHSFWAADFSLYLAICWWIATVMVARWSWRKISVTPPDALLSNHTTIVDVAEQIGYRPTGCWSTSLLDRLPGNQMFQLAINEKTFEIPRLGKELDGLSIVHFSDLHYTGYLKKEFFEFVVDRANELDGDCVVVTGDIVDKDKCIDWIPSTLGKLASRHGVFFVLGNHDKRVHDVPRVRKTLTDSGLIDLGGQWLTRTIREQPVLLAGSELPWFGTRKELSDRQPNDGAFALRMLLSHSPDEFIWAQSRNFDLMLAGHTHGGQIRLPVIGPVIAPSVYGVKYASGVFYNEPTLMHVSRGISGAQTIRLNCPPELTKVVLKCA